MSIVWPDGATCGMCGWWVYHEEAIKPTLLGICDFAREEDNNQAYVNDWIGDFITHRDFGCRAWKPKDETA